MKGHHNVEPKNILLVSSPKYQLTGMELEYYEDKSD